MSAAVQYLVLLRFYVLGLVQAVIKRVVPYIEMEEFHPDNVAKVSKACKSICQWVRAMYVYHNVALQVRPLSSSFLRLGDSFVVVL